MCIYLWEYQHGCMAAALLATGVDPSKEHWTLAADKLNDKDTLMTCVNSPNNNCTQPSCAALYSRPSGVKKEYVDFETTLEFTYLCQ